MQAIWLVVIVGLLGGIAVGFQGPLASVISQRIGTLESVFIVHIGGAIASLIPLVVLRGGQLTNWRTVPWYALGAGVFGLGVISAISYAIPRLGVATTTILIVAGQLLVGLLIDHFGLLGNPVRAVDVSRLAGVAVVAVGIWLLVR